MQQGVRFPIVGRENRHADAGRHGDCIASCQRYRQLDGGKQSFKKGHTIAGLFYIAQQDGKFVTSHPRYRVVATNDSLNSRSNFL